MFDSFFMMICLPYLAIGIIICAPGAIATFIINRRIDRRYGK